MSRVIRTTDIDTFLNEDEEIPELLQNEQMPPPDIQDDEEDEPLWDDINTNEIKQNAAVAPVDVERNVNKNAFEEDDAIITVGEKEEETKEVTVED